MVKEGLRRIGAELCEFLRELKISQEIRDSVCERGRLRGRLVLLSKSCCHDGGKKAYRHGFVGKGKTAQWGSPTFGSCWETVVCLESSVRLLISKIN